MGGQHLAEKRTYVTENGIKEFWWESDGLFINDRLCGSVSIAPPDIYESGALMTQGPHWLAAVEPPFEKKILGTFRRTTYGRRVIGAYRTKQEAQKAVEDALLPISPKPK